MVTDAHVHLCPGEGTAPQRIDTLLPLADLFGIERLVVCLGPAFNVRPDALDLRRDNDFILQAVAHRPDRVSGLCYCSPAHPEASVAEIDRCVAAGPLRGIKLWVCRHADDPGNDPIAARAAELGVPIVQHTWLKRTGNMPTESTPQHLIALARRHPGTQFIMAHSGGDWPLGIRLVRDTPNIAVDLCGGNPEQGQAELAVALLGAERVVWGSDAPGRSFASQLAKVTGADLSEYDRKLVLCGNASRMMRLC